MMRYPDFIKKEFNYSGNNTLAGRVLHKAGFVEINRPRFNGEKEQRGIRVRRLFFGNV